MQIPLSVSGIAEIVYDPRGFFLRLKDHPKVLTPYIIVFVIYVVFTLLVIDVAIQPTVKLFTDGGVDLVSLEQQGQSPLNKIRLLHIFDNISIIVRPLILSLFVWLSGRLIANEFRYKQALSLVLFAEILYGFGRIINAVLIARQQSLDAGASLAPLARLVSADSNGILYRACSGFDIFRLELFLFWEIIIIGIGLSTMLNYSTSKGIKNALLAVGVPILLSRLICRL